MHMKAKIFQGDSSLLVICDTENFMSISVIFGPPCGMKKQNIVECQKAF